MALLRAVLLYGFYKLPQSSITSLVLPVIQIGPFTLLYYTSPTDALIVLKLSEDYANKALRKTAMEIDQLIQISAALERAIPIFRDTTKAIQYVAKSLPNWKRDSSPISEINLNVDPVYRYRNLLQNIQHL